MASRTESKPAVDDALQLFGEALAIFDPFRFRTWAELGLTTAQLRVISLLRQSPGVTAGELANRLSVTPPTISGIVDRLVKLDLVRREDDRSDRRLVRNVLTEKGEAACARLERGAELYTRRLLVEMDEADLESFNTGMKALISASQYVARVEPDLAAVALPGLTRE